MMMVYNEKYKKLPMANPVSPMNTIMLTVMNNLKFIFGSFLHGVAYNFNYKINCLIYKSFYTYSTTYSRFKELELNKSTRQINKY